MGSSTLFYPSYQKPEEIVEIEGGVEWYPIARPGDNRQSRVETPGGRIIVQGLAPRVQFLRWSMRHRTDTQKGALFNFFNDVVEWSKYSFDYVDPLGKIYHGCRWFQDGDNFAETSREIFKGDVLIRLNTIQYILASTGGSGKILRSIDNGETWPEINDTGETNVYRIVNWKGRFYGGSGVTGKIFRSLNTVDWAEAEDLDSPMNNVYDQQVYKGFLYAIANGDGKVWRTPTGNDNTWAEIEDLTGETSPLAIVAANGFIYIGCGTPARIYRSADGVDFGSAISTLNPPGAINEMAVAWGYIYAATAAGRLFRAPVANGTAWAGIYTDGTETDMWSVIGLPDGRIIAGSGPNGKIFESADGSALSFSEAFDTGGTNVRDLAIKGDYVYAAVDDSIMRTLHAGDLSSWETVESGTVGTVYNISPVSF